MSAVRAIIAFLIVWLPYIVSTYLAERLGNGGLTSQCLMLVSFALVWPAAKVAGSNFGLGFERRVLAIFAAFFFLGLATAIVRWRWSIEIGASVSGREAGPGLAASVTLVGIAFIPSLTEDVLTRGFPLFAWRRGAVVRAVLLSAALYTLNHLWRFDWGWSEQVRLFAMGSAYAAAAVAARSLWAAVAFHLAGNVAPGLLASLISGLVISANGDRLVSAAVHGMIAALLLGFVILRDARPLPPDNGEATAALD